MDDLISRQAAIDAARDWYEGLICGSFKGLEKRLRALPSAPPEIVRCKDCKYAEYIDDVKTLWCTECGQGRTVAPNDFCSYAERREVTT